MAKICCLNTDMINKLKEMDEKDFKGMNKDAQGNRDLADVSKSNSIEVETLAAKVFMLANELAIAGYGNAAVKLHTIHNGMITKGHYYSC